MNDTTAAPMRAAIATIRKDLRALAVPPNMPDLAAARAGFSWDDARAALEGLPGGALNIAHEAVPRHAPGPRAAHTALRWLGAEGEVRDLSYRDLDAAASRFAHVLRDAGLARGDRVAGLLPQMPEP
ncbi:MAG: AMP-binding protein, partial [Rubrivivax sp.]